MTLRRITHYWKRTPQAQIRPFGAQASFFVLVCMVALLAAPAHAVSVTDNKIMAQELNARIPALEREAALGNQAATVELARVYFYGVHYMVETLGSRLRPDIPMGGAGVHRSYNDHFIQTPQLAKLRSLLEAGAARGDAWSTLKLAELLDRPAPESLGPDAQDWALGNSRLPPMREIERAFAADPQRALRLYAAAAEPANAIANGTPSPVPADASSWQATEARDALTTRYAAVAFALERLADRHAESTETRDAAEAQAEYQRLAKLIESPLFQSQLRHRSDARDLLQMRQNALLRAGELQARSGRGLQNDCPATLQRLRAHADAFPDAVERQLGSLDRVRAYAELQSSIGLLYYTGCAGQPVNRTEALAWFSRANAGALKLSSAETDWTRSDNKQNLSPPALVALAELLDNGAPGVTPQPRKAFEAYWIAKPSGPVLLRTAQMLEEGEKYSTLGLARAHLFYCRAAREFAEPGARQWLQAHPEVQCKN